METTALERLAAENEALRNRIAALETERALQDAENTEKNAPARQARAGAARAAPRRGYLRHHLETERLQEQRARRAARVCPRPARGVGPAADALQNRAPRRSPARARVPRANQGRSRRDGGGLPRISRAA